MTLVSYELGITGRKVTFKANTYPKAMELKANLMKEYDGVWMKTIYNEVSE